MAVIVASPADGLAVLCAEAARVPRESSATSQLASPGLAGPRALVLQNRSEVPSSTERLRRTARSHRGSRIRCSRRCSRGTPRARRPSSGRLGASSWTASRDSPSRTEVTRSPCFCRHETRPRRDDGARQSGVRFCPTPFEHVKRFFMTRDVPTRSNIFTFVIVSPRRTTLLEEGTFYFLTF